MPYASPQQLIDRFGERLLVGLTDRGAVATGTIDAAVVARALADTDALIDGHLGRRFRLPIAAVPALLADLALEIAFYKLHVHTPDDKVAEDYKLARRTLEQIAAGTIALDLAGTEPATTGGGGARVTDRARPMTAETMKGWV